MQEITVPLLITMAREYWQKPGNNVGGNLHNVLEDGNLEDHHIDFCIEEAIKHNDHDGIKLGLAIRKASKTQRKKLWKRYSEYA